MKLTKVLKDKKGAALEMAVFFMIIVFCFCTLLTTMTLTARSRIKLEKAYLNIDLNAGLTTEEIIADCISYFDAVAAVCRTEDKTSFTGAALDAVNSVEGNDNGPKKITDHILSRYNVTEIPSQYESYKRPYSQDNAKSVIAVVANANIPDPKTLQCTLILGSIRFNVEYKINENNKVIKTIVILDK